jgi:hypothetical protein
LDVDVRGPGVPHPAVPAEQLRNETTEEDELMGRAVVVDDPH